MVNKETKQIAVLVVVTIIGLTLALAGVFATTLTSEQAAHLVNLGIWTVAIAISLAFVIL